VRIKREILRIGTLPFAPNGDRVEPEQQPAVTVIEVNAPAKFQGSAAVVGQAAGEFQVHSTAREVADIARSPCFMCKHFDTKAWAMRRRQLACGTLEEQTKLKKIRVKLIELQDVNFQNLHSDASGEMDIEAAMASLGICRVLTEITAGPTIVFPAGGCPRDACTAAQPMGYFMPATSEADRAGSAAFDQIMLTAAGK
jgi:hypothetical protein